MEYLIILTLCVISMSYGQKCPELGELPVNCVCSDREDEGGITIKCVESGLTNFDNVPEATNMRFENNTMRTLVNVPYNRTVRHLYLVSNDIRTLYDGAFSSLTELETLSLANNRITCLTSAVLQGLTSLKTLVLTKNPLYFLRADTIQGSVLPSLTYLYLDSCHLYEMEDKALDNLSELTVVSMTHNRLRSVPVIGCPGHSLDNLLTWDLSNNEIEHIPKSNCHLPNLEHLYLTNNNIVRLNETFLGPSIENIRHLHLGHNRIESIDNNALQGALNISLLDLTYNRLTKINETAIPWKAIDTIQIHDNPWDCNCHNHWLVDKPNVAKSNDEKHVRCATPDQWKNVSVTAVDEDAFKTCQPSSPAHPSRGRVIGIVLGSILLVACVFACSLFAYRIVVRKRTTLQNEHQVSSPNKTSVYRRMGRDSGVSFERQPEWSERTSDIGPFEI